MPKKYSHAYDFAYELETDEPDPHKVDPDLMRQACIKRMNELPRSEIHEACGCIDTAELEVDDDGEIIKF